jgi:hypothetical protein
VFRLSSLNINLTAAFIAALAIIFLQLHFDAPKHLDPDSGKYLSVALELYEAGVFTDGDMKAYASVRGPQGEGMFFAPAYPAFLAGMMWLDERVYEAARCVAGKQEPCGDFTSVFVLQGIFTAFAAFMVWISAYVLTGRKPVAWLAMALALLAEAFAHYAGIVMTEALVFPLFTLASLMAVLALKNKRIYLWALFGLSLGALALVRPSFSYLFYASFVTAFLFAIFYPSLPRKGEARAIRWRAGGKRLLFPLILLVGYFAVTGPWIIRNGVKLGHYSISGGYAGYILAQRLSFNDMRNDELLASFVYGLPDFGDSLAKDLFPKESYERLDYANPQGFYQKGYTDVQEQSVEKAGGRENLLPWLIKNEVLGNLGKHISVTFSMLWRGMWVSKYWGLIAIPVFAGVFIYALRSAWLSFVIFSMPPWFMAGFHAFTSVNVVRYNLILVPCLAIAAAFAIVKAGGFVRSKLKLKESIK